MSTIYIRQNDNLIPRYVTLRNADNTYPDLSDAVLTFHAGVEGDPSSAVITKDAELVDASTARVRILFLASELAEIGSYAAEIQAEWPDGTIITFPTRGGQFKIEIVGEIA